VKASTGYSFFRTQHLLKELVQNLEKGRYDAWLVPPNKFKILLDRILIQVLVDKEIEGSRVFELLFQKNSAQKMLRFLDEKTSVWEDLTLMRTVPTWTFMKAFFKIVFKRKSFSK
jgi:lycopene beta-cyclase